SKASSPAGLSRTAGEVKQVGGPARDRLASSGKRRAGSFFAGCQALRRPSPPPPCRPSLPSTLAGVKLPPRKLGICAGQLVARMSVLPLHHPKRNAGSDVLGLAA
ncbi:unnamed protein product, partial [Amoebophrya sp. A120]